MTTDHTPLFRSFWQGGFEAANQRVCSGERIDMHAATQHDLRFAQDYQLLTTQGLHTAREGLHWYKVDRGDSYDLSHLGKMLAAARSAGIQVIWSLCHYGWPEDLDFFSPAFVDRFARYCQAVARCVAGETDDVPFYNPINEISFLTYAIGEAGFIHPCAVGRPHEVKRQLIRAVIAGSEAIWSVDPRARIVNIDPIMQVIAPAGRPDLARHAVAREHSQFQAWDMLGGWEQPELGGHPRYLDIIGVNYYHNNQWELEGESTSWEGRLAGGDPRWLTLSQMLANVYHRYQHPLFISETSHIGVGRGPWIRLIAQEVRQAIAAGVPVSGICLYPVIDRHEWEDPEHWHNSGLWDVEPNGKGELVRVLNEPYSQALGWAQAHLAEIGCV